MWIIPRGKHQFWFLLAFALVAVGGVAALYGYGISLIAHDWAVLSGAQADLLGAELARRNLNGAEQRIAALAAEISTVETGFADPETPLPFIEAIEGLGRRLGVKTELTLSSSGTAGKAEQYRVTVSGPFPRVAALVRMLGAFPFLISTGDAELTRSGAITEIDDSSSDNVRLSVVVKIMLPR